MTTRTNLEFFWTQHKLDTTPAIAALLAQAIDAVFNDLCESYTLALEGNLDPRTMQEVYKTVCDAYANNYDFLPVQENETCPATL